jgi:hypothetical protein
LFSLRQIKFLYAPLSFGNSASNDLHFPNGKQLAVLKKIAAAMHHRKQRRMPAQVQAVCE